MNPSEANALAKRLKSLMPRMTDDQLLAIAAELEKHPSAHGCDVVDDYAANNEDFVYSRFIGQLRAPSINERVTRESAERRLENSRLKRLVDEIEETIAAMSEKELLREKTAVLAEIDAWSASLLATRHPRHSDMLKALIYQRRRGLPLIAEVARPATKPQPI